MLTLWDRAAGDANIMGLLFWFCLWSFLYWVMVDCISSTWFLHKLPLADHSFQNSSSWISHYQAGAAVVHLQPHLLLCKDWTCFKRSECPRCSGTDWSDYFSNLNLIFKQCQKRLGCSLVALSLISHKPSWGVKSLLAFSVHQLWVWSYCSSSKNQMRMIQFLASRAACTQFDRLV